MIYLSQEKQTAWTQGQRRKGEIKMTKIKISKKNAEKIENLLNEINGRATAHTYTGYTQIENMANAAEKKLSELLLKKDFQGATWSETSGDKVANCYKGSRIATNVKLQRGSSAWFLVSVSGRTVWNEGGGESCLTLTAEQDAAAIIELRKQYTVKL